MFPLTRSTSRSRFFGLPFSPSVLFAAGEQGAWYDPSDYGVGGTLFQSAADTTPVTAVEQPVRLMLDKSKGLVLGPELVTNGDFSSSANWTLAAGGGGSATIANGLLTLSGGFAAFPNATQSGILTSGRWYRVTVVTTSAVTLNSLALSVGGVSSQFSGFTAAGAYTRTIQADGTDLRLIRNSGFTNTADVDLISVQELPGNHATAPNDSARPVLRARYNLLTYSEEFDNAAWIKSNVLTPTTGETAPDGTATAWKIVPNTTNTAHEIYQSGLGKGGSARYTIWAKPAGYNYLAVWNGSGAGALLIINVQTGTVVSAGGTVTNISITADANGFYRIQFTEPLDTFLFLTITNPTDGSNTNYAGNGTDGVIVWHPDLRLANDALNMPAYQRVGAATDYDTNGFLPYLAFDGTDDAMSTAAIDFSGTDKMTVFAGVRKLSDAALSILTEFGTGSGPTGEFNVRAPGSAGATYGAESAGTTYRAVTTTTIYAAPITNVLRASYDISGPLVAISVNGASAVQNTASQGTGNYGNYSLFIGSRNNGSLFFNGRIYSLIVRGAASSASEIAATEAWVNARTGAY